MGLSFMGERKNIFNLPLLLDFYRCQLGQSCLIRLYGGVIEELQANIHTQRFERITPCVVEENSYKKLNRKLVLHLWW